ncbi:ATP-binding protein [Cyanobium sp. Morenito 9A2]|uniref:ATP-binding protein n=1 Tax=Cyanobium sp. Morenito 9A2 TaxID=2823718 RepID=UPI0020CFA119|nr:ATP-binding protein [Cyanobium sp. Morenito 9A2]MCP9848758.1 HAMP domain-containing protein [Cyanobium sp. Morenito 9A2]
MAGWKLAGALPLRFAAYFVGGWGASLLMLQGLLGSQLERAQIIEMGPDVAQSIRLSELALERFPPAIVAQLSGLELALGSLTAPVPDGVELSTDGLQIDRSQRLRRELCQRLPHCPRVVAGGGRDPGAWIELVTPLEPVWLFAAIRPPLNFPPDPLLLSLSLVSGSLLAGGLFLLLDVQQPLQQLERALARVGVDRQPPPLPQSGAWEVRRLAQHFNAMLERLELSERERSTMLAGIAHDLKTPLTRLRLRLSVGGTSLEGPGRQKAEADLDSLERITRQFLLFAGGGNSEVPVDLPLDQLLAELAAQYEDPPLLLALTPLRATVQPTALSRALANLIDNAFSYGQPPVRLKLIAVAGTGFELQVWDQGAGIPESLREQALLPFTRLDRARGGQGHCGLGLAIAARVAQAHGGVLRFRHGDVLEGGGFCVSLSGDSMAMGSGLEEPVVSKSVSTKPSSDLNPIKGSFNQGKWL